MIDLESAFEHHDDLLDWAYFLDLETGEVVMIMGEECERWFRFRDERMRQRVLEWLEAEGIEIIKSGS